MTFPLNQITGYYGEDTRGVVIDFQKYFGLTPDGIIVQKLGMPCIIRI